MERSGETLSLVSRVKTISFVEEAQLFVDNASSRFKIKRYQKTRAFWYWLTNVKGTRIRDDSDKFPTWTVRTTARNGNHHFL